MPGAVFLSYASQDAEAAQRVCDTLRAAGVEVWFDQSELVGGDAWDQKIRIQIKGCALFIPILSKATQGRREAYFRLEWRLADERTHLMAKGTPFLLPVTIDETTDRGALVPDSFFAVQWTKAPKGVCPHSFGERVHRLLSGEAGTGLSASHSRDVSGMSGNRKHRKWLLPAAIGAAGVALIAMWIFRRPMEAHPKFASVPAATSLLSRAQALTKKTDILPVELDTAEELLEQAAKIDPADATIWAETAVADGLYMEYRFDLTPARRDLAKRHADQAFGLDPGNPTARFAKAYTISLLGHDRAAAAEARNLLLPLANDASGDQGRVLILLGKLEGKAGINSALGWFDRAAKVPGYACASYFSRGVALCTVGRLNDAEQAFDQALAIDRPAKILLWKAYLELVWDGDPSSAAHTLELLPESMRTEDMAASTFYLMHLFQRDYDSAVEDIRAVPRDYMSSNAIPGPTGYFKGFALSMAGKTEAAQLEWKSGLSTVMSRLERTPNDESLMEFKALLLSALGEKAASDQAWKEYKELFWNERGDNNLSMITQLQLLPVNEAIDWVARDIADPSAELTAATLRLDPFFDRIRSDPRFALLLAKAEADPRLSPKAKPKAKGDGNG